MSGGRKKTFSFSNNYLISVKIMQSSFGSIEKLRIFAIPKRENVLREAQERRLRIRVYLRWVRKLFFNLFSKTFGQFRNSLYFCTRKSGLTTERKS